MITVTQMWKNVYPLMMTRTLRNQTGIAADAAAALIARAEVAGVVVFEIHAFVISPVTEPLPGGITRWRLCKRHQAPGSEPEADWLWVLEKLGTDHNGS